MSLLNNLELQKIDDSVDDLSNGNNSNDDIDLGDQIDEGALEQYWDNVVNDLHKDPDWFSFNSK